MWWHNSHQSERKPAERKIIGGSFGNSLLVHCLIFVLHEIIAKAEPNGEFIKVPPFNTCPKDLLQHLNHVDDAKFYQRLL